MSDRMTDGGVAEIFDIPEAVDIPEDARPKKRGVKRRSEGAGKARAGDRAESAGKTRAERRKEAERRAEENAQAEAEKPARRRKTRPEPTEPAEEKPASRRESRDARPEKRGSARTRADGKARRKGEHKPARLADIKGDIFLEEWDAPSPKRKKKKHKKSAMSGTAAAVNLLLLTGIAAMFALGGMLVFRHNVFVEMKQAVEAQTFYDGTTIEGVDVSNMTLSAALDYWRQSIEPAYAERAVTLDNDSVVTASQLGYRSDYESVLYGAWSAGRRGSLEQRYRAVVRTEANPVAYSVDRELYSDRMLDAYVQNMAAGIDTPAVDAGIQSFDPAQYTFVFTESQEGRRLDAAGLKQQIGQALNAGGGSASVVVETVQPAVTKAEVTSAYGMVSTAVTNASSSSRNRLKNIELAMSFINGKCLKPGEEFSFNQTVGKRTTDRGFKRATAYSSGEVTEEVGGGICQVSTTLFNAAVKADLQILERHNHSLTVGYVDKGKDATVNWNTQDLRFRNNTDGDIYISCMLSDDKRVRFAIFGKLLENGETITLEAVTTKTIKYDTRYEATPLLARGQSRVVQPGKNGFKAEAYKVRWDANGNQISKELLCKSTYKSKDAVVMVGM